MSIEFCVFLLALIKRVACFLRNDKRILVSEVLSSLIARLHDKGIYEGFLVGKENIHVSILQFADDTLIFCKYDTVMLDKLKQIIECF